LVLNFPRQGYACMISDLSVLFMINLSAILPVSLGEKGDAALTGDPLVTSLRIFRPGKSF